MGVLGQDLVAEGGEEVVGEDLGLADGVLGVGGAVAALLAGGDVGDGGGVARGPGVLDSFDGEEGGAGEAAVFVLGEVGGGQDGVRFDSGGPHDGAGGEAGAVAEDGDAVLAGFEPGLQAYVDVASAQFADRVDAHLGADLGEDPVTCFDEHPFHVLGLDVVVVPRRVAGHVLQLAEGFDAREAAADEDEGEGGVAEGGIAGGGGDVHLFDDVVAQADGFFDRFESDAVVGESRDGEGAGDGARGEDEFVVLHLDGAGALVGGGEGADGHGPFGVVDALGLADDDAALAEDAAQRDHDVTGGDCARGRFGEEGLVRHVGLGSDHRDLGFAGSELSLEAERRIHADVAAADDQDARTGRGTGGRAP